jgi:hypothetical protein
METIANGKYLLFDLKFMALPRVSVAKRLLLIEAKSNSNVAPYPKQLEKLVKLSLTSTK